MFRQGKVSLGFLLERGQRGPSQAGFQDGTTGRRAYGIGWRGLGAVAIPAVGCTGDRESARTSPRRLVSDLSTNPGAVAWNPFDSHTVAAECLARHETGAKPLCFDYIPNPSNALRVPACLWTQRGGAHFPIWGLARRRVRRHAAKTSDEGWHRASGAADRAEGGAPRGRPDSACSPTSPPSKRCVHVDVPLVHSLSLWIPSPPRLGLVVRNRKRYGMSWFLGARLREDSC